MQRLLEELNTQNIKKLYDFVEELSLENERRAAEIKQLRNAYLWSCVGTLLELACILGLYLTK